MSGAVERARERPRVVAVRGLMAAFLVGAGVLLGSVLGDDSQGSATLDRLDRSERSARMNAALASSARRRLEEAEAESERAGRRTGSIARENRRLRAELRKTRRALARARQAP